MRQDIPIFLGAEGPKNIAMCAELCDGWLAMLFSPEHQDLYRGPLEEGFAREGARRTAEDFEVAATVPMIVSEDLDAAIDALRPFYALYFGGMGAKGANFHANVPIRMGYEKEILEIQDLYLEGRKNEAEARIPSRLIEQLSLVGPREKIRDDLERGATRSSRHCSCQAMRRRSAPPPSSCSDRRARSRLCATQPERASFGRRAGDDGSRARRGYARLCYVTRPQDSPRLHRLLASRSSPTQFDRAHQVSQEQVDALLEAARWAPSAGNSQPWAFIVGMRGDKVHGRLLEHLAGSSARWAPTASVLVANLAHRFVEDTDWEYSEFSLYDLGQAVAHMTVQAQALGLSVRQFRAFDQAALAGEFVIPAHWEVATIAAYGVPAAPAPMTVTGDTAAPAITRERRSVDDLLWPVT